MKVIFNKSDLVSALDRVQRAAQTKVTSNTNNGFFISAAGGNILIQANDYTIGIKTSCPANIEEEGVTVIAAPQLQSTIRMMPAGDITMEKGDHENLVSFQSGSYVSKFPTRDQVEFPDVQEMDHRNHCLVKCRDFADMVSLVSFAAANDKQKPIFSGILFTAVGAFILYGVSSLLGVQSLGLWTTVNGYITYPTMFSTYYVNMSIFLAYAATFPDYEVLLFFILPIKVKFLGIIYGAMLVYQFIVGYGTSSALFYYNLGIRFVITASLLNFVVFFFTSRRKVRRGPIRITRQQAAKQQSFRHEAKKSGSITRHKCAVCGRTDETNPELEFRFCSKCNGNYEYCQDHLFTHTHVQ